MDRKEQVKFSLRDVFGLGDEGPSRTRSLMETYGLSPAQITQPPRPSATDVIREAIETGTIPMLEDHTPQPTNNPTQRDDLALQRWREMAGLED